MKHNTPRSPFSTRLSGSARETELRIRNIFQWKKERPPLWAMVLTALAILSCGGLVSCHVQGAEEPSSYGLLSDPGPIPQREPEVVSSLTDPVAVSLDSLTLDETGEGDDRVTVTSFQRGDSYPEGLTIVEVTLGGGQAITWEYPYPCFPKVLPLFLTSNELQSLVLEMDDRTSNYGAACYFILEVEDGTLVERAHIGLWESPENDLLPDEAVIFGSEAADREDSPLQALRIPTMIDKWHAPCYVTLTWDGGQFSTVSDGYFTDRESLPLTDSRELILEMTGRWQTTDGDFYELYYDQVQVLEGDVLLQTITPQFPLPQPRVFDADTAAQVTPPEVNYPSFGFSADYSFYVLDIRDVNFDGFADLGLPCDTTHNDVHAWYLWDEPSQQFRYAFALQGDLTVDQEHERLIENRWEEASHIYSFNAYGQLVWLGPDES